MWKKAIHECVCPIRKSKAGEFDVREHLAKALSFKVNNQVYKYYHKKQSYFILSSFEIMLNTPRKCAQNLTV